MLLDWRRIYMDEQKDDEPYTICFYSAEDETYTIHSSHADCSYLERVHADSKECTYVDTAGRRVYCAVAELSYRNVRSASAHALKEMERHRIANVQIDCVHRDAAIDGIILGSYRYTFITDKQAYRPHIVDGDSLRARAQNLARFLSQTPANLMTPAFFVAYVRDVIAHFGLDIHAEVYVQEDIERMGMRLFMAVARGSAEGLRLMVLTYCGRNVQEKDENDRLRSASSLKISLGRNAGSGLDMVMVGKGITFDSGGISLKPSKGMEEMRADMMGAAVVVASLVAAAQKGLRANVRVIVPLCENMPGGRATKPGDVVVGMSGKSVEINNTDAEGRLVLADALTLAEESGARVVLTASTLTGACVTALGHEYYAVYTQDDSLYERIERAGRTAGDSGWRMPLDKAYLKCMESGIADLKNCGYKAGSCTAAAFLNEFVKTTQFVHLDIAGMLNGNDKGVYGDSVTGRPCAMLFELIKELSAD